MFLVTGVGTLLPKKRLRQADPQRITRSLDQMQLQDIKFAGKNHVEAYGDMGFRMNGGRIEGSILILPGVVKAFEATIHADLDVALMAPVFAALDDIEIMILGTGETQNFPDADFRKSFVDNNIALEVMDTGAACRTYNILVSEDRRVAAALIAI